MVLGKQTNPEERYSYVFNLHHWRKQTGQGR